jgi:hypothetical protein
MIVEEILFEKAPLEFPKKAQELFDTLAANLNVKDGQRRGEKYDDTGFYAIRIQPAETTGSGLLLQDTEEFVKSPVAKKNGIKYLRTTAKMHSGKFSSVLVNYDGLNFGIVVAAGANKGETFEKDLLIKLDNLVAGIGDSKEAEQALAAILKADPSIKRDKIDSIVPRSGKTQRSSGMSSDEVGKIIADIIIKMKGGKEHYISLKNITGSNIAQFGCSDVFNDDLSVNTKSDKWKEWMAPLGLDPKKIKAGLESYLSKTEPDFSTEEILNKKLKYGSAPYKMMESMWGTGYIYLREKKDGFEAFKVDHDYLANNLLKDLQIVKILYPSPARKAIEVHLKTANGGYKIRLRNKNDPNSVRPTIIQLEKTK